jgi:hypothetical protein
MSDRTIALWAIETCMSAIPIAAQAPAPTTTAFDGTYAGVSRTFETDMARPTPTGPPRACSPSGVPAPLTIAGGAVRWPAHSGGTAEGSVNAQGVLVMRTPFGAQVDAQIDGRGTVTGRYTSWCSYHIVWQKEGQ